MTPIQKAYALLWQEISDRPRVHEARRILLASMTKDEQRDAIAWVKLESPLTRTRDIGEVPVKPTECQHLNFQCNARVGRLTDGDDGPVTGYTTDIKIVCVDCQLPFRFMGLPAGSHFAQPRVSADGLELRAPIEPAYVTEICGMPLKAGAA